MTGIRLNIVTLIQYKNKKKCYFCVPQINTERITHTQINAKRVISTRQPLGKRHEENEAER